MQKENGIATTLLIIGCLIIAAGIITMISLFASGWDADELLPWLCGVGGFISGMSFIGFAEVISLLQIGVDQLENLLNQKAAPQASAPAQDNWEESLPEL